MVAFDLAEFSSGERWRKKSADILNIKHDMYMAGDFPCDVGSISNL